MAGTPKPVANCRYLVDVGTLQNRSASKVAGVSQDTPPTPLNLGFSSAGQPGVMQVAQIPTNQQQVSYLSIDFAVESGDKSITDWYEQTNQQGKDPVDLTVHYFDSKNQPAKITHYFNCYPIKHSKNDVSPAGAEYLTESIEVTYTKQQVDK